MVTRVEHKRVSTESPTLLLKEASASRNFLGPYVRPNGLTFSDEIQPGLPSQESGVPALLNFGGTRVFMCGGLV